MANRKLYDKKAFEVQKVLEYEGEGADVWHLLGRFFEGSIRSNDPYREYRIRVKPDSRWKGMRLVRFKADRIYESESAYYSRKYIYGSGNWYVSPFRTADYYRHPSKFVFEDFEVLE